MRSVVPFSVQVWLRPALSFAFLVAASAVLHGQTARIPEGGPAAGRVLWLRGDRGVTSGLSDLVTDWRDSGTTHNDLGSTSDTSLPEWRAAEVNGRPALHFDGNDCLNGSGMPIGSYTKVAVCQLDDLAATNTVFSSVSWRGLHFGGTDLARLSHVADFVTSTTGVQLNTPIVLVATYDATNGQGVLYQDGVQVGSGNDGKPRLGDSSILLGSSASNLFTGSIAEVMAYDHVLNATDLYALHRYLFLRYHLDPSPMVQLDLVPRPGQIFQRDATDGASVVLAGSVQSPTWTGLSLEVTRDGAPFDSSQQTLTFANGSAPFSFSRRLVAGKFDYEFSLYALRGAERRLVARIGNVAVGDIWLINGQSNAVAADYYYEQLANADCQTRWVRSFGTATRDPGESYDLHWDLAEGEDIYSHCTVGAWGLRIGALLAERYAMPIGLINGAVGSTSISQHQRDDANPENQSTIYGRLLCRAHSAGVRDLVRGMLWYQGEADGDFGSFWRDGWQTLRQSWQIDFPAMTQVYLFQIHDNCLGDGRPVREVQRELIDTSINTYVMSTTAAPFHEGCHFHYLGYRELGDRLARVLGRDFYGSLDTQEIDPPNILSALWNDAAHTQVLLTFRDLDDRLVFEPGAEANFYLDDEVAILGGTVNGNTVLLQLSGPSAATMINHDGHLYDGPWLKNARDVGALAFFDVVIQ